MSYPFPGNYSHYGYGQPNEAQQLRQKHFEEGQLRGAINAANPAPQNTPGSGVMSPNSLARRPAWETNYAPSLDAFHSKTQPQEGGFFGFGASHQQTPQGLRSMPSDGSMSLDPYAPSIQRALDAASPIARPPGPSVAESLSTVREHPEGGMAITPYGTIAAHTVAPGTPQPTAAETAAATTANGVIHQPPQSQFGGFNSQQEHENALASLRKSYPAIFQKDTPENTAFVDYALKNGEAAAHANVGDIMDQIQRPVAANPSALSDPYSVTNNHPIPGTMGSIPPW